MINVRRLPWSIMQHALCCSKIDYLAFVCKCFFQGRLWKWRKETWYWVSPIKKTKKFLSELFDVVMIFLLFMNRTNTIFHKLICVKWAFLAICWIDHPSESKTRKFKKKLWHTSSPLLGGRGLVVLTKTFFKTTIHKLLNSLIWWSAALTWGRPSLNWSC